MPRILKLVISYDGTRFAGWQRQPRAEGAAESIQGLLEEAIARFEGAAVTVHGAGRTDAGVHALGQVASVQLTCSHPADALGRGLNASLPPEIRVTAVEDVAPDFHARFSARSKTYRYMIRNAPIVSPFEHAYVWHVPEPIDLDAMQQAAAALLGPHDFSAFASAGSEPRDRTRTIMRSVVECRDGNGLVCYEVTGTGFLRHMVRAIVGTLVEIGRGWRPASSMASLAAGGERSDAGATAPPHGLFLVAVDYD
jgi:tRNA pseudouridine38-40 synthase